MMPKEPIAATAVAYIKVETASKEERWIAFDEDKDSATVINPKELQMQMEELEKRLAGLPPELDDKQLLEWAKQNYPYYDVERERTMLQAEIERIKAVMAGIGGK